MIRNFLLFMLLVCASMLSAHAQQDSSNFNNIPPFAHWENSWGAVVGMHGMQYFTGELGFGRMWHFVGEGGGLSLTGYGSLELQPNSGTNALKGSFQLHNYGLIFGWNASMSALYYMQGTSSQWVFRPQIGIGLVYVFLSYGINLYDGGDIKGFNRNVFSISGYIPLHRKDR